MNQKFKELWLIPIVPGIIAGIIVGVPFMVWGAWYSGVKLHSLFSLDWFKAVLTAPLPMWLFLVLLLVVVAIVPRLVRRIRELKEEVGKRGKEHLALQEHIKQKGVEHLAEIAALTKPQPKLHGVWNPVQTLWHMGTKAGKPAMQIVGWINLSTSDTNEILYLLAAYIEERRADIFMDLKVEPQVLQDCQVVCFFEPPLETDPSVPFTATIVVEDHKNRKYELPRQTFRPTTPAAPFPIPIPAKPAPELHIAWRGKSGWCWTQYQGERVVRISGDGPIQLDNATEKVIMTGARIEGAEFVGVFDNFEIEPGTVIFRGMNLDFKGIHPKGKEPLTVKLIFIDLRGNEYPTKEATFQPIDAPERYNGIPWAKV
jgi:hypothetical protein